MAHPSTLAESLTRRGAGARAGAATLCWLGLGVAVLGGLAAAAAGFGTRFGLWPFRTGFLILQWAAYAAALGGVLSLVGLIWGVASPRRAGWLPVAASLIGIVIGAGIVGYPLYLRHVARAVPRIHDISTDTDNPPAFVAALPLRAAAHAENPPGYEGAAVAAQQHQGYPQIKPAHLAMPPRRAFDAALATAKALGWTIVAAVPAEGRIEATDSTFWFHFTDDVVIRVAPEGAGARVDIRSESRVGKSDLGTNARRVERYLAALERRAAAK